MKAYFEVGEEVIVNAQSFTNDDVIIGGPYTYGDNLKCPHCGAQGMAAHGDDSIGYYLENTISDDRCCYPVAQRALRKKHKPGNSFKDIMANLDNKDAIIDSLADKLGG